MLAKMKITCSNEWDSKELVEGETVIIFEQEYDEYKYRAIPQDGRHAGLFVRESEVEVIQ